MADGETTRPSGGDARCGDDAVAERLQSSDIEPVGQFATASNATLLVRLRRPGDDELPEDVTLHDLDPGDLAVYKPRRGESPLWDFPAGTLHRREVAAYEVSAALGWDLVPVTIERDDAPLGPGSLQRFVAHDPERHYFWLVEHGDAAILAQLRRMVLFDLVIDNADRKGGHVLLEDSSTSRLQLIDHGVCLSAQPKLRTVAWDFAGEPVDAADRDDVAALTRALDGTLGERLRRLLAPDEIGALAGRVRLLAALGRLPEPTGPRPFPWPLL